MKRYKKPSLFVLIGIIVFTLFSFRTNYFEVAKQIEIYTTLFKELNLYYIDDTNPAKLTESAINELLNTLDPYTRFYDEQGVEDVKMMSTGEYSGIGATTRFFDNKLFIYEIFKDLPAEKAGIKVGDEITKVNGIVVSEENRNQISQLLKGSEETTVNLEVSRQGKTKQFALKRQKVEVDPVPHYQMIDDKVGYISFIKFNSKASSSVKSAFLDLKDQGMEKLILDLRGNLGGLLNEAIEITNFFIPKGEVVVTTKAKLSKWSETYRTKNEPIDLEIPIVVLVNGRSASASEIVAGSLQDLDRAVILGERSFGKGLVQRYRDLPYGTKLKITISKYYTPSGRNIQELNYTNREGNDIPKYSDSKRNEFKTKNGRTVFDGGGIEPDVKIEKPEATPSTEALLNSNAIFNYATNFYYENSEINSAESYVFSNKEYEQFIDYLNSNPDSFKTKTERVFEAGLETAEKDEYDKEIQSEYNQLIKKVQQEKIDLLETNKEQIKEELSDEILRRYYFNKGEYINHVYHNKFILEAVDLLNNQTQYNSILQ